MQCLEVLHPLMPHSKYALIVDLLWKMASALTVATLPRKKLRPRKPIMLINKGMFARLFALKKEQKFSLTPISEDTGLPEGDPIAFEGNCIDLSRNNTAPKNSTITSHTQATIAYHEGKWSIEDKSEYKTTFVQAFGKIEIQQGTLILLGNQLYRFDN